MAGPPRPTRACPPRPAAEDVEAWDPFAAQEPLFATTVAASLQGRVALGPRAGQPLRGLARFWAERFAPPNTWNSTS